MYIHIMEHDGSSDKTKCFTTIDCCTPLSFKTSQNLPNILQLCQRSGMDSLSGVEFRNRLQQEFAPQFHQNNTRYIHQNNRTCLNQTKTDFNVHHSVVYRTAPGLVAYVSRTLRSSTIQQPPDTSWYYWYRLICRTVVLFVQHGIVGFGSGLIYCKRSFFIYLEFSSLARFTYRNPTMDSFNQKP